MKITLDIPQRAIDGICKQYNFQGLDKNKEIFVEQVLVKFIKDNVTASEIKPAQKIVADDIILDVKDNVNIIVTSLDIA